MQQWFFQISEREYGEIRFETWFVYGTYCFNMFFQEFLFNAWYEVSPWLSQYYLDTVKANTFKEIFD